MKALWLVPAALLVAACTTPDPDPPGSQGDDATATSYLEIQDFKDSTYQDAWYDIGGKMAGEFDQVCGDTYCEGDFSNLTPLKLACAVSSKEGSVHDCAWTFVGSIESVDPKTSAITVDAPTYQCHFKAKTTAGKLVTLLQAPDAIHATLPGQTGSISDALFDCFQHGAIGATPISFPDDPAPVYVEASDYYKTAASQQKWANAKAALNQGFDNVCGDTFCSSDYSDLQSMAFVCSVTKSTGNIKSCDWVFGGSYNTVNATKGTLDEVSNSFVCPVAVKGTLSQLITALTAAGSGAIRTPLPGETTSAYDALLGCLP